MISEFLKNHCFNSFSFIAIFPFSDAVPTFGLAEESITVARVEGFFVETAQVT